MIMSIALSYKLAPKQFVAWGAPNDLTGKNQYWVSWVSDDPKTTKTAAFDKLQHIIFVKELLEEAGYTEMEKSND